jgi:hypothetical protein
VTISFAVGQTCLSAIGAPGRQECLPHDIRAKIDSPVACAIIKLAEVVEASTTCVN